MLSSQLKIKIKTSLFLALLFATSSPVYAGLDVDMVANIKNSTCKSGLSNLGNIDLGVVGVDYFLVTSHLKMIIRVGESSLSL